MKSLLSRCAGSLAIVAITTTAQAAEYVVDGALGSDGNDGTAAAPFQTIARGLDEAQPGDTVVVKAGTYAEAVSTVRDGTMAAPIVVRAEQSKKATLQASGNVLAVAHGFHVFEGFVIDGQFGPGRTVEIETAGSGLVLRDVEIKNAGRNCIDMDSPDGVLVEKAFIHHCLFDDPTTPGPDDAHGITGTGPTNLTVRDSEIAYFSGDAIQLSPSRAFWDNLLVERTVLWTGALPDETPIYPAGTIVGENAFDTKTPDSGPRPRATFRGVLAYGFRGFITNQGAFNLKENADVTIDGATVHSSELAFRLRGPALVKLRNVVAYGNDHSVRYEDGITDLSILNVTLADPSFLVDGGGGLGAGFVLANALLVGAAIPPEAGSGAKNLLTGPEAFVDAAGNDYHLLQSAPPVDAGDTLADVTTDRDGVPRPFGAAYDVGAYEWTNQPPPDGGPGAGGAGTASAGAGGSPSGPSAGAGASAADGSGDAGDDGGCGCRAARGGPASALVAALALAVAMLRRRR